jgi:hypothetical protein
VDHAEAGLCLDPLVADALLRRLEVAFPLNIDRSMSQRQVDHVIGQGEVVNFLRRIHKEERE